MYTIDTLATLALYISHLIINLLLTSLVIIIKNRKRIVIKNGKRIVIKIVMKIVINYGLLAILLTDCARVT